MIYEILDSKHIMKPKRPYFLKVISRVQKNNYYDTNLFFYYLFVLYLTFCLFLKAAEAGNLDEFIRLFEGDASRLDVKDGKLRTAAHQAVSRNKVNILRFIKEQNGGKRHLKLLLFSIIIIK